MSLKTKDEIKAYQKAYKKAYYESHKIEIKAYKKAYYDLHKIEIKAYKKAYYESHKIEIKAYKKAYYESHPMINFLGKQYPIKDPIPEGYVRHHYLYDHLNMTDNIVVMSMGDHLSLHNRLRKLGYQIPHKNVRVNDNKGF